MFSNSSIVIRKVALWLSVLATLRRYISELLLWEAMLHDSTTFVPEHHDDIQDAETADFADT